MTKEPTVEEMLVRLEKIVGLAKQQVAKDVYPEDIKLFLETDFQIWADRIRDTIQSKRTVTREQVDKLIDDILEIYGNEYGYGRGLALHILRPFLADLGFVVEKEKKP